MEIIKECPREKFRSVSKPTYLFNGMIYPLTLITIKGMIWYQGENNVISGINNHLAYSCLFPNLINYYRKIWYKNTQSTDKEFGFGFVQISGHCIWTKCKKPESILIY